MMGFSVGNRTVERNEKLSGLHIGNLKVSSNATAAIGGIFIGNIVAEAGAKVIITGRVLGNVISDAHIVTVTGNHVGNRISRSALSKI
jgi:hypothetical protein